jgi:PilZ domain
MLWPTGVALSPSPQERRYRRFKVRYPVRLRFRSAEQISELNAVSRNVSIAGLLLETKAAIPEHSSVSFVMTLQGERFVRPVELIGEGAVVRLERSGARAGFAIAVECKNPITQVELCLPAA